MSKRIALIHATPVAMPPVVEAFRRGWTDVDTFNVLDEALSVPARARSTLNASSSTLNVSTSVQPRRNASTTGGTATGVAWIRAIRFDMPVSFWL